MHACPNHWYLLGMWCVDCFDRTAFCTKRCSARRTARHLGLIRLPAQVAMPTRPPCSLGRRAMLQSELRKHRVLATLKG